ncbi:FAD-containing oxidoreductase [Streptococcus moroccensis]|uniref:Pyruvate/2-oxoglutarate dehydrogenase complex dihydrolipoamide dehydrogenase (E3) component n=1 Tax=Streptococcus moroccensis TaxID=1451356 RepID=A0ABT9YU96_9STRE|nr:FAD-containing oxidoreductase [Streptococcus moroccensis]MDQ0223570.1 pyruvate/2-oxoglutarate dehydrogenase complex dihydrolipoamide dehydrogenase (E3) component [Streptococcus moroccensis]
MLTYDIIVIGFGKAGKTLAAKQASSGKKVALIEQSKEMYGGTCINIACIPTKTMLVAAEKGLNFDQVIAEKDAVVTRLNAKNYATVSAGVDVIDAKARFVANKVVEVVAGDEVRQLTAETIVINTGAVSIIPPISGLTDTANVVDSTGIQQLENRPEHLGIIGAGNIGLEFAGLYNQLGSQVTVFDGADAILSRFEPEIAQMAKNYMEEDGIKFNLSSVITAVSSVDGSVQVSTDQGDFLFDVVLYATGRKPNVEGLNIEATDIALTERGAIKVDDFCQTTVPGVFAVGDVNGGPQFTYISLDDFRIVNGYLNGLTTYSLKERKAIPTSTFLTPPLAQVGLTEAQAEKEGLSYLTKTIPVAAMPRGHVNADLRGAYKVVVDKSSKQILGATFFGAQAHELINLVKMAMDNHIPATYFQNQIFTHPTMVENFNDLFAF